MFKGDWGIEFWHLFEKVRVTKREHFSKYGCWVTTTNTKILTGWSDFFSIRGNDVHDDEDKAYGFLPGVNGIVIEIKIFVHTYYL